MDFVDPVHFTAEQAKLPEKILIKTDYFISIIMYGFTPLLQFSVIGTKLFSSTVPLCQPHQDYL